MCPFLKLIPLDWVTSTNFPDSTGGAGGIGAGGWALPEPSPQATVITAVTTRVIERPAFLNIELDGLGGKGIIEHNGYDGRAKQSASIF